MPLYRCEECGCVENTALGQYHTRNMDVWPEEYRGKALCSEHSSPVFSGGEVNEKGAKWHGQFDKRSATGWYVDETGYIWKDPKASPFGKILGTYREDGSIEPIEVVETPVNKISVLTEKTLPRHLRRKLLKKKS